VVHNSQAIKRPPFCYQGPKARKLLVRQQHRWVGFHIC